MIKLPAYVLTLVLLLTLMPGLGGCAEDRTACDPDSDTQPPPLSTRPAAAAEMEDEVVVEDDTRPALTKQMDRQVHNAELADMSLAEMHFLPHRPGLNGTGTQRLDHLAWLVKRYGGTISLDLDEPQSDLAKARHKAVVRCLRSHGLPAGKIRVCFGLPQSRGLDAQEAINVYNDTRYQPKEQQSSTVLPGPALVPTK